LHGEWQHALFSESLPALRRRFFGWARLLFAGHALTIAVSFYFGLWLPPVQTTFASFYGGWLLCFCSHSQHIGLRDNVPDFRLCCRTFEVNPIVRFLYWHMNYHAEHHVYAAVPCYHLRRLHGLIRDALPPVPNSLVPMWRQIVSILKRQRIDPGYQYEAPLPPKAEN
jgi:fatty acid desaturase